MRRSFQSTFNQKDKNISTMFMYIFGLKYAILFIVFVLMST